MNRAVLVIGKSYTASALRLKEEAEVLGITLDFLNPSYLYLENGSLSLSDVSTLTREILNYDTYFFRGMDEHITRMQPVARFFAANGKRVVEKCFAEIGMPEDKIVHESVLGLYTLPESRFVNLPFSSEELQSIQYPIVVKKIGPGSSKGLGVRRVKNIEELESFTSGSEQVILQKYYPIIYDTRVLVVGGICLGGFDRYKPQNEDFLTTKRGGKREVSQLTDTQIKSALEAAKLQGLEIAGVDMFTSEDKVYIIEVNSSPQFNIFERKTGVNAALNILRYIV